MIKRIILFIILSFPLAISQLYAADLTEIGPAVQWQDVPKISTYLQQNTQKSSPPACELCLRGEVAFDFNSALTEVRLDTEYLVNFRDPPNERSGTLVLGLFVVPVNIVLTSGTIDPNIYNVANGIVDTLDGQAFMRDISGVVSVIRSLSTGDVYVYMVLGEVMEIIPTPAGNAIRAVFRDLELLAEINQGGCTGTCFFSIGDSGGDPPDTGSGGDGCGTDCTGNTGQQPPKTPGPIVPPSLRRDCNDRTPNRASPDTETTEQDTKISILVLGNDKPNSEGGIQVAVKSQPVNGVAAVNGQSIEYTPNTGFVGKDEFLYLINSVCGGPYPSTVTVTVTARTDPPPPSGVLLPADLPARTGNTSLLNISTSGFVGDCENRLIAGFIVADMESSYLIRGRGRSHRPSNGLANPKITLSDFSTGQEILLDENDDWQNHPEADLIPSDLQPQFAEEAALMTTLPPGAYLATLESGDASNCSSQVYGVGIIEVNDLRLFEDLF